LFESFEFESSIFSDNLTSAEPSPNATKSVIDKASFQTTYNNGARTVWLKGFLNSKKTSQFKLSLQRSYYAIALLYVSSDATSANKQLIANSSFSTESPSGVVNLTANNL